MKQHTELLSTTDWLTERDAPVAIVLTETLEPSGGPDSIIFPPTYARQRGDHPYAITTIRTDIPAQEAARNNVSAILTAAALIAGPTDIRQGKRR